MPSSSSSFGRRRFRALLRCSDGRLLRASTETRAALNTRVFLREWFDGETRVAGGRRIDGHWTEFEGAVARLRTCSRGRVCHVRNGSLCSSKRTREVAASRLVCDVKSQDQMVAGARFGIYFQPRSVRIRLTKGVLPREVDLVRPWHRTPVGTS
jgi:hypothetical protein